MKIDSKKILVALGLLFNPSIKLVNQGSDQVPVKLDSPDLPQLPLSHLGKTYTKGMHAETLDKFTRSVSSDYRVQCNEAAEEAFPDGMVFLVGEKHAGEGRKIFANSPKHEHAVILNESADSDEIALHPGFAHLKSLVCEHIDDKDIRDYIDKNIKAYHDVSMELIQLISPNSIEHCKWKGGENIFDSIIRCEQVVSENYTKIKNFKGEKVQELTSRYQKLRNRHKHLLNEVFGDLKSKLNMQREATMAKNIAQQVKLRDKYHPNAPVWAYMGHFHGPGVYKNTKKALKKTPICRVQYIGDDAKKVKKKLAM